MNRSLQESFNELLEILENYSCQKIDDEFVWKLKCEEIRLLFINMSYILNSYRPHQARQQIITIMQHQMDKRKESIQKLVTLREIQLATKSVKRKLEEKEESVVKHEKIELHMMEMENYDELYRKYPF